MRKQLPIRVDEDLLQEIKIMLAINDITFNKYVIDLIKRDLREKEREAIEECLMMK